MRKLRSRITYANVMSSIAVFLLLGGGAALAAKHHHKHKTKIGTPQIKASAITAGKLKNEAVVTAKIRERAVTGSKLASGSVSGEKISGGAITTDKIASDAVTGVQVNESTLSEVPSANAANPSAFAKINSNGTVDAPLSKAITSPNVSHPSTGVYCVSVSPFAPRGGQVSSSETTAQLTMIAVGGSGPCPQVAVRVFNTAGAPVDGGFYLEVYR